MSIRRQTVAVLTSLRGVWDEEAVDELDHALQSAARALDDGADDELALAAALHDIGHSPLLAGRSGAHEHLARQWLAARFGVRVGWLAGAHVAAKRHLAATEPGYAGALSDISVASLRRQGGAAVDPEWAEHPWWPDALRLRRYDDAAKDPAVRGVDIETVAALTERVAARHTAGGPA